MPLLLHVYQISNDDDDQGSHMLEKYLNLEGFLEKSLKIKFTLKSTEKSLKKSWKLLEFYYFLYDLPQLIES